MSGLYDVIYRLYVESTVWESVNGYSGYLFFLKDYNTNLLIEYCS